MARGGSRQGRQGVGYSNRTDLMLNRAPASPSQTPASGPVPAPPSGGPGAGPPQRTYLQPEDVPRLDDPSGRPTEPVTAGLMTGRGAGPEALGVTPGNPLMKELEAAYMLNPTDALARVIARFRAQGRL